MQYSIINRIKIFLFYFYENEFKKFKISFFFVFFCPFFQLSGVNRPSSKPPFNTTSYIIIIHTNF